MGDNIMILGNYVMILLIAVAMAWVGIIGIVVSESTDEIIVMCLCPVVGVSMVVYCLYNWR